MSFQELTAQEIAQLSPRDAQLYFANESIEKDYKPWAANQTQDNLNAFNAALAMSKQSGGVPPPTSYEEVTVDVDLVQRLFTGEDANPTDWQKIFVHTTITPVPPVPTVPIKPVGYPVGPQAGSVYLALDGARGYPDGAQFTDVRGTFVKHVIANGIGVSSFWTKL